jgi:heme exporter protein C
MMALLVLAVWVVLITFGAPLEETQGWSQKIFYFHVPHALGMYACFLMGAVFSIMYLRKKEKRLDAISLACLEVGLACCAVVLTTGPIWAKPIWGVYWTWEPRLTTTLFMGVIFLSAYVVRFTFQEVSRARLIYSLLMLIGCANIPLVHLSVRLWRGVHPTVLRNPEGLGPRMKLFFLVSLIMQVIFLMLVLKRRISQKVSHVS